MKKILLFIFVSGISAVPFQVQARDVAREHQPMGIGCPPEDTGSDYCYLVCRQVLVHDPADDIPPSRSRNWWEPPSTAIYQAQKPLPSRPTYRMVCEPQTRRR